MWPSCWWNGQTPEKGSVNDKDQIGCQKILPCHIPTSQDRLTTYLLLRLNIVHKNRMHGRPLQLHLILIQLNIWKSKNKTQLVRTTRMNNLSNKNNWTIGRFLKCLCTRTYSHDNMHNISIVLVYYYSSSFIIYLSLIPSCMGSLNTIEKLQWLFQVSTLHGSLSQYHTCLTEKSMNIGFLKGKIKYCKLWIVLIIKRLKDIMSVMSIPQDDSNYEEKGDSLESQDFCFCKIKFAKLA